MNPLMPNGPQPGPAMAPQGPPAMMMGAGPSMPAQAPQQPVPTPDELAQAHIMLDHLSNGLGDLVSRPGITKEDVFSTVADMMGKGLFSDPQGQKTLIGELTSLPADEPSLRRALGAELLKVEQLKAHLRENYGAAEAMTGAAPAPQGAAPDGGMMPGGPNANGGQ